MMRGELMDMRESCVPSVEASHRFNEAGHQPASHIARLVAIMLAGDDNGGSPSRGAGAE